MKKYYNKSYILKSSFFIFLIAAVIHSLYDITGFEILKPFVPINESVWEHMKMMFYAGLIWAVIEYSSGTFCYFNFWFAKGISILLMTFLVPMIFYTYTAFTGKSIIWVDIAMTFIIALIGQLVFKKLVTSCKDYSKYNTLILIVLIAFILLFAYFSYYPPDAKIFIPQTQDVFKQILLYF